MHPKIKAGLVTIGLAALAAGARACVVVIADLEADVNADARAQVVAPVRLTVVTDLPENPPAVDAGAPDAGAN